VAHFPGNFDCNNICIKVSSSGRDVFLLRIDTSGGSHDISYDAWNFLAFGVSASEEPHQGGPIDAEYETVGNEMCADLLNGGKLPFVFSTALGGCVFDTGSFVAQNSQVFNIQDAMCTNGVDEECSIDSSGLPTCPHPIGTPGALNLPVNTVPFPG
jgi:hypothetical protein